MQLEAEQTERRKFQAIAEPPKSKFMQSGHYTADVDLTALNVIADVGVSPSVVPRLFVIFARFFGVKIPSRPVTVPGPTGEDGKRASVRRDLLFIPSKTHCKQLPAIGGELHNIQVTSRHSHPTPPHPTLLHSPILSHHLSHPGGRVAAGGSRRELLLHRRWGKLTAAGDLDADLLATQQSNWQTGVDGALNGPDLRQEL